MSDASASGDLHVACLPSPLTLLFVCTGNAGRSQLAQAFGRRALAARAEVLSAGVAPWPELHPSAIEIFDEEGLDLEGHAPKSVEHYRDRRPEVVVTIGEPARLGLPEPLRRAPLYRHWDIADPAEAPRSLVPMAFRLASVTIQQRLELLLAELRSLGWLKS
jgi:protein-tyrosine-phosphatase